MIEIKITIDAALTLLLDRMKYELKVRQKQGIIKPGLKLENLQQTELMHLVEASIFDTVFLLPVEIITSETNLAQIITGTVRALSRILHREEFQLYSQKQAQKLLIPIASFLAKSLKQETFANN